MYFVAAVLLVLSGVFYAAENHELGSLCAATAERSAIVCSIFCSPPASPPSGARPSASASADFVCSKSCDDDAMPVICPTCQLRLARTTSTAGSYGGAGGFAGWTGFGPGGTGSSGGFGSVGMTVAPAARAASPVVVCMAISAGLTLGLFHGP